MSPSTVTRGSGLLSRWQRSVNSYFHCSQNQTKPRTYWCSEIILERSFCAYMGSDGSSCGLVTLTLAKGHTVSQSSDTVTDHNLSLGETAQEFLMHMKGGMSKQL